MTRPGFGSRIFISVLFCLAWLALAGNLCAQSSTTGSIVGIVTDPSGAALPGASIQLRNLGTGAQVTAHANGLGQYRFALLPPGSYRVTIIAAGFRTVSRKVPVSLGQATTLNAALPITASTQVVNVTSEASVVQTNNANISTTFSAQQIALTPNPGDDLTDIAQTAPGAVMNTEMGYGNFESYGLPATANLFTLNGEDDNDPFLNVSNSGATNLLLGQNEIQQATVVNNGYSGQYGRLAGANVNYVSKSGTNGWHGNVNYLWNGRVMNSNNFFNNASATPRPFDNVNQWAASLGGPIVKNHSFFFVDQEGIRIVLPTSTLVNIPSPGFQAATLANLATANPSEIPFYAKMFSLYNSAAGAGAAVPLAGSCGGFSLPTGGDCATQFRSTAGNFTHEWLLAGRYDQMLGANDHAFLRLQTDQGVQATYTDPISPVFNAVSTQPEYQGQLNETHTFGATSVNQFIASFDYYSALFQPANLSAALSAFPTTLGFSGGAFQPLGGEDFIWPQGRNVTQYQFVDDFSHQVGNSDLKFGADFRRDDVSDHDFGFFQSGYTLGAESLGDFYNGVGTAFLQSFPSSLNQPVKLYNLGAYIEDDWSATRGLKLDFSFRVDHNSNPVCNHFCFAHLTVPFTALSHDPSIPYNKVIVTGMGTALPGYHQWDWQPRLGFAWTPFARPDFVLRGGFGIFASILPASVADSLAANAPLDNSFVVTGAPLAPGTAGNMFSSAAADNAAFLSGFNSGGTLASISASTPGFSPPNFFTPGANPYDARYYEWNLEIQGAFSTNTSYSIDYVGNHGIGIPVQNNGVNAYCAPSICPGGFAGLPAAAPDARFGTVTQLETMGVSNFNGVTYSLQHRFTHGFSLQGSYTYGHALDDISNGGFLQFNLGTNSSILFPQDPYNFKRYNYGNADYNVTQNFSISYLWTLPFNSLRHWGPSELWRGWTVSGTLFAHTPLPLTVIDSAATGVLAGQNYGGALFANWKGGFQPGCSVSSVYTDSPAAPCLLTSQFSPSPVTATGLAPGAGFGNQMRNQFLGADFFDTDMMLLKNTQIPGWEQGELGIGVQAFNLFNHPNFDQPVADIANPNFGTIVRTANVPTSVLGSFLGGDASPRIIQITARLTF